MRKWLRQLNLAIVSAIAALLVSAEGDSGGSDSDSGDSGGSDSSEMGESASLGSQSIGDGASQTASIPEDKLKGGQHTTGLSNDDLKKL